MNLKNQNKIKVRQYVQVIKLKMIQLLLHHFNSIIHFQGDQGWINEVYLWEKFNIGLEFNVRSGVVQVNLCGKQFEKNKQSVSDAKNATFCY